ncbi:protease [Vibrio sp. JCM 19236]|nr:protease [Vibrio sp. JCM 19236]
MTTEDRIQQPMLLIGWPTTYQGAEGNENIDMLARVLGSGRNSILYQKLVKTEKHSMPELSTSVPSLRVISLCM